jgi:hypothetical protein
MLSTGSGAHAKQLFSGLDAERQIRRRIDEMIDLTGEFASRSRGGCCYDEGGDERASEPHGAPL